MPGAPSRPRPRRRRAGRPGSVLVAIAVVLAGMLGAPGPTASADAGGTGVLAGRVTLDGAPVVEACVETSYADGTSGGYAFTVTDATGHYSFDQRPVGTYRVRFTRCSATQVFRQIYYLDTYDSNGATPVTVSAGATTVADMVLPTPGDIQGTVTNDLGVRLAGICVSAIDFYTTLPSTTVRTDAQGHYVLGPLAESVWYVLFADCPTADTDYPHGVATEFYDDSRDFASAYFLPVPRKAHLTGIDATLDRFGSISGHLSFPAGATGRTCVQARDLDGHAPLPGVVDADGGYTIEHVAPGDWKVEFEFCDNTYYQAEWYADRQDFSSAGVVRVSAGTDTPGIDAQLARPATISGRVTGPGGTPLADACVDLYQGSAYVDRGTTTGSDGTYALSGLVEGRFSVRYRDCGRRGLGSEWWDDEPTRASSTPVTTVGGTTTTLHDVQLAVDMTPPDTVITSGPAEGSVATFPIIFGFASVPDDDVDTFECRYIDGSTTDAWGPCTSPMSYSSASSTTTFQVRATDDLGNVDPTPATRTFRFDTGSLGLPGTPGVPGAGGTPAAPSAACVAARAAVGTAQGLVGSTAGRSTAAASALARAQRAVQKAKAAVKKASKPRKPAVRKKLKAALARQSTASSAAASAATEAAAAARQLQAAQAEVTRAC